MSGGLAIELHAVSVRRGGKWVLRDVSLNLRPGERWALVGDNGAGKTQLLKLLCGDVWPTPTAGLKGWRRSAANRAEDRTARDRAAGGRAAGGRDAGGRDAGGRDAGGRDARGRDARGRDGRSYRAGRRPVDLIEAKSRIAYIGAEQQDKYARYGWNLPVRDLVATGLHRTDLLLLPVTPIQARRVAAALRACGLTRLASREFLSLSYGQKRLALLARALVQDPDWLLLDEFYNGLDADFRRRIDAILDAARARGRSWVATAHRAADVPRGTRRLLELEQGRVRSVKRIRPADLARLARRAAELPRTAATSAKTGRAPKAEARASRARPLAAARRTTAGHATARPAVARRPAVILQLSKVDLYVQYRPVLRDLHWQLRRGEHWAVYGANGSGKSSFLKLLYGDLSPALGGRIERTGFPRGTPITEWKRQVGYVSPELQSDYGVDVSVLDLVASGRYASIGLVDAPTAEDQRAAKHWLKFFGLLAVAKRRPRELSYGQLRRALIARAMAADARILLLDEPLTGLDPRQRGIIKRLLRRLMKRLTLIVAVHHPEDLPRGMTHGLRLHNRRAYPIDSYSAT